MHKKSYISALLMLVLIVNVIAVPTLSFASPMPALLFDLDVSGYSTSTKTGLVDGVSNTTTFSIFGDPTMGEISSINGTTKYMTFARGPLLTDNKGTAIIADTANVLNKDALTVEVWAKTLDQTGKTNSTKMFAINNGSDGASALELMVYGGTFKFRPNGTTDVNYSVPGYADNWVHYVFIRKWNATSGGWDYEAYANGQRRVNATQAASRADETGKKLCIGGSGGPYNGFQGSIAKFCIYDGILTGEQIEANYNNEKANYVELPDSMLLESITPAADSVIDCYSNEITLEFDNFIDATTLNNITLVGSDGSAPKGGIEAYIPEELSKILKIKYGKLTPNQTYTLTIEGLTSLNNKSFNSGSYTADFTSSSYTTVDGKDYIINEEFTDYEAETEFPSNTGIKITSNGVADSGANIIVKEINGDKYLELTASEKNKATSLILDFPPISDGTTIIEMKMQPASNRAGGALGTALREMCKVYTNIGTTVTLAKPENNSNIIKGYIAQTPKNYYYQSTSTDSNGFHHMRFTITKDADTGKIKYKAEDVNNPSWGWVSEDTYYGSGETSFHSLEIANMTAAADDQLDDKIWVSSISVQRIIEPKVLKTDFNNLTNDSETLNVTFDNDMNAESFTANSILIKNKSTDEVLKTEVGAYDTSTNSLPVTLNDYFDEDTTYTVTFSGVTADNGAQLNSGYEFTTKPAPLTVNTTTLESDIANKTFNISNSDNTDKMVKLIFVTKDSNGRFTKIFVKDVTATRNTNTTATFANDEWNNSINGYTELYIWDVTDGNSRPVLKEAFTPVAP